jgi:hypothetical protein
VTVVSARRTSAPATVAAPESQIMQCEKCDAYVAVLIFADNAWTPDVLKRTFSTFSSS